MTPPTTSVALTGTPTTLVADLRDRLLEASRVDGWITISLGAPDVEPERLLRGSAEGAAFLWDPPEGESAAGLGAARILPYDRSRGLDGLREDAREARAARGFVVGGGAPTERLRWFGGLAFAAGGGKTEPWTELGEGFFVLPRVTYLRRGGPPRLVFTARGEELRSAAAREHWESALLAAVGRLGASAGTRRTNAPVHFEPLAREPWRRRIEEIRSAIADGRFEKIVAARRSRVEFESDVDPVTVLGRLSEGLRWSTRFLFRAERTCFLGATPERLVLRAGSRIATEALAGSIGLGDDQAERLLASGKDRREHDFVVLEILRKLRELGLEPEAPVEPSVRTLREVLHLRTPIRARSDRAPHVLRLVEALHPTPAVGGVPTADAIDWIVSREDAPRGWYSGPVGWFDAAGDGEFAVALRSCLVEGREAWLYAGAGIVHDSDPDREYDETELKQRSLLRALGA